MPASIACSVKIVQSVNEFPLLSLNTPTLLRAKTNEMSFWSPAVVLIAHIFVESVFIISICISKKFLTLYSILLFFKKICLCMYLKGSFTERRKNTQTQKKKKEGKGRERMRERETDRLTDRPTFCLRFIAQVAIMAGAGLV